MELDVFLKEHFSFNSYFFQPSFPSNYLTGRIIYPLYKNKANISAGFIQLSINAKRIKATIIVKEFLDDREELTQLLTLLLKRYFLKYSLHRIRLLQHSMVLEID